MTDKELFFQGGIRTIMEAIYDYVYGEYPNNKKVNCTDCILDGTDACSRGAGRAVDDEICEDFTAEGGE